jgi:hypothetical protein
MLKETCQKLSDLEKVIKILEKKAFDEKKSKACLFNLVIDVENIERLKYYQKVIQELIDYFPCRIFLIHFDKNLSDINLEVSLLSPKAAPNLVCDLIEINLPPKSYPAIFSLLFANFAQDLPIYYLPTEHGDHLSDFTMTMAKMATRVICDSTDVSDLDAFIENIIKLNQLGIPVSDLNWSRIESWREIIAKNLNNELLNDLKLVEIVYNHKPEKTNPYPFQALLLKGFLQNRYEEFFKKPVKVELKESLESHIWQGALLSVNFYDHKLTKQVFLRNISNPQEAIIHFESSIECYLPSYVQFTKTESGQSLVKEIRHSTASLDYLNIIKNFKTYL